MCASSCVPNISNEQGAFCQGVDAAALLLPPLLLLLPPLLLLMPPRFSLLPLAKKRSRSKARVLGPAREKAGQGRGSQSTKFGNSTSDLSSPADSNRKTVTYEQLCVSSLRYSSGSLSF